MKLRTRVVFQLAALCLAMGAYGFAADNAYLYIVHGIPGRDVAKNLSPVFPIDVLINGDTCLPRDVATGIVSGPFSFPAGTYEVLISEANSLAPCTNTPIINSQVNLTAGASVSAVLALSGGQPILHQYTNDLSTVAAGNARFTLVQVVDDSALQATLTQVGVKNPQTFTVTTSPGKQGAIAVPYGTYLIQLMVSGNTTVLASDTMALGNQSATFAYATGESINNSVTLVNKTVLDVF
jgi:hypothetical protein